MRHLKTIDAWYHQHLRRCLGIKASYGSRKTNRQVCEQAGRPTVPSLTLLSRQVQQLAKILITPPANPLHHVVLSPGIKDKVKRTKGLRRGHPQRYCPEVVTEAALLAFRDYLSTRPPERSDLLDLKQRLAKRPEHALYLAAAPTCQPTMCKQHEKFLGYALRPFKKNPNPKP